MFIYSMCDWCSWCCSSLASGGGRGGPYIESSAGRLRPFACCARQRDAIYGLLGMSSTEKMNRNIELRQVSLCSYRERQSISHSLFLENIHQHVLPHVDSPSHTIHKNHPWSEFQTPKSISFILTNLWQQCRLSSNINELAMRLQRTLCHVNQQQHNINNNITKKHQPDGKNWNIFCWLYAMLYRRDSPHSPLYTDTVQVEQNGLPWLPLSRFYIWRISFGNIIIIIILCAFWYFFRVYIFSSFLS